MPGHADHAEFLRGNTIDFQVSSSTADDFEVCDLGKTVHVFLKNSIDLVRVGQVRLFQVVFHLGKQMRFGFS